MADWRIGALALILAAVLSGPARAQDAVGLNLHIVESGETLASIAASVGSTADALLRINALDDASLRVGQRLLVPLRQTALEHRVRPGDTLYGIAALYGISAAEIATLNDMRINDIIYVDQLLRLRVALADASAVNPYALVHSVRPGETLSQVAIRYDVTLEQLIIANEIDDPALLYVGAELRIPGWEVPLAPMGLPSLVEAVDLRPTPLHEGQTARLWLQTAVAANVTAQFLGRAIPVHSLENGREHYLLLSVPVFTEPALERLKLTVVAEGSGAKQTFPLQAQILSSNYGAEEIILLPDRLDLLNEEVEAAENARLLEIFSVIRPWRSFGGGMRAPAEALVISDFGTHRSYNGGPYDRFHSGTDFAALPGTPIFATAPGTVVLAEHLAVRGLATIIDHGWGVYTGYWHQQSLTVSVGQTVAAGQIIGSIGNSGRVSGVHLHWELWVNGSPVDPIQWLEVVFP